MSPMELYEGLKQVILLEYKNDSFKRFTRTEECLKLTEKYQNNKQVLLPQLSIVYNYSGSKFQNKEFTEMDIEFLKKFEEQDPNWELIYTDKKDILLFLSSWNYFPNVFYMTKFMLNYKIQLTFDYSLKECASAVFGDYFELDPNILKYKCLEYKQAQYVIMELFSGSNSSFTDEPRIRRATYTFEYDPELKRISLRSKPLQIPDVLFLTPQLITPSTKKGDKETKVKGFQDFKFYTTRLTQVDEQKTLYEQIGMVDIGRSISKNALQKRCQTMYTSFSKKLKSSENDKNSKVEFSKLWEGLPIRPIAKLLVDLNIEEVDKKYAEKIAKRKKVFDISNFVLHFTSLKRKEIEKVYYQFLQNEHNSGLIS
jgi:hypothetical protein